MRAAFWACVALACLFFWGLIGYGITFAVGSLPKFGFAAAVSGIAVIAFGLIALRAHRWSE